MSSRATCATTFAAAAAVTAQAVAGKATRDALFLTSLDFAALPGMLVAASIASILLLAGHGWATRRVHPGVLLPALLVTSGTLFLAEWALRDSAPVVVAILVYLHVSSAGALVGSGFWLLLSERFDPNSAKRQYGQIAGAGTAGGLLGGLLAERMATAAGAPAMLLVLAGLQIVTAVAIRALAASGGDRHAPPAEASIAPARAGLPLIAESPHLRNLAALVLLGTTTAALLEYLFKAGAVATFGPGDNLLRFFAVYYAGASLLTLLLQAFSSRPLLARFGLGLAASTPSIAVLAGAAAGLLLPGFGALLVARGGEAVLRASWFRAGYELFYTPMATAERRAAKSLIDVGFDRAGDAMGGAIVRLVLLFAPAAQSSTILLIALAGAAAAIALAARMNGWYLLALERSLVQRGGPFDPAAMADESIRRRIVRIDRHRPATHLRLVDTSAKTTVPWGVEPRPTRTVTLEPELQDIRALRSRDRRRAVEVLCREGGLAPALVHDAIPLLGVNAVSDHALFALCKVAEEHVGQLADALLDPNTDAVVRRRLARVFAVCVSQRAADALVAALEDPRLDVRFQAARSLAAVRSKNPRVSIDRDRVQAAVRRAAANGEHLAYVFALLSLMLPGEPLHVALQGLQSDDARMRGTALEYLEGVLPPTLRQSLWPAFVHARDGRNGRGRNRAIANLLGPDTPPRPLPVETAVGGTTRR